MLQQSRIFFTHCTIWHWLLKLLVIANLITFANFVAATQAGNHAGKGIIIGLEYAGLDSPNYVKGMAAALSETEMPGMKHYAEAVQWGEMQKAANKPIDFSKLDLFVREYQKQGFTELTVALKSHSKWADKDGRNFKSTNPTPKKKYENLYVKWIHDIVERYDGDGKKDMPGLRWPVRYYEIGSEFSSYEPEPVDEYLAMLKLAYTAAHKAYKDVLVAHAAFLTTPVNLQVRRPSDYETVWENTNRHDNNHGLEDIRKILNRPDLFDVVNVHNLGDPYEIEHLNTWLQYEMSQRNYRKPIIISDTIPTSYIAWGPATNCKAKALGTLIPPATEQDRCALARYFTKLVNKDKNTLAWTRKFVAADHVHKTIIAAEQGYALINLSFTIDLPFLTAKFMKAGAGISAWGGALAINRGGKVQEKRPLFYSIQQLIQHVNDYDDIERVQHQNTQVRIYKITKQGNSFWVAWYQADKVVLPENSAFKKHVEFTIDTDKVAIEALATHREKKERKHLNVTGRKLKIALSHYPIYIFKNK